MDKIEYFTEVKDGIRITIGKVSETEISSALALKKQIDEQKKILDQAKSKLEELQKSCNHKVMFDRFGFMYDERVCAGCGCHLGLI